MCTWSMDRFPISRCTSRVPCRPRQPARRRPELPEDIHMPAYYLRLAFKSFRRTPGLTALMLGAIALGIAVCVMTMTVHHAMSGNPIWWKNDRLYAVTMDNWDPTRPADLQHPELPPPQVTYKDSMYLLGSNIPERKVLMYSRQSVLTGAPEQRKPLPIFTRLTTADFFPMFDVP